jgi:hypothetical protein
MVKKTPVKTPNPNQRPLRSNVSQASSTAVSSSTINTSSVVTTAVITSTNNTLISQVTTSTISTLNSTVIVSLPVISTQINTSTMSSGIVQTTASDSSSQLASNTQPTLPINLFNQQPPQNVLNENLSRTNNDLNDPNSGHGSGSSSSSDSDIEIANEKSQRSTRPKTNQYKRDHQSKSRCQSRCSCENNNNHHYYNQMGSYQNQMENNLMSFKLMRMQHLNLTVFEGKDYESWSTKMEDAFKLHNFSIVIKEDVTKTKADDITLQRVEEDALSFIRHYISGELLARFGKDTSTYDLWKQLEKWYKIKTTTNLDKAVLRVAELKCQNYKIEEYTKEFNEKMVIIQRAKISVDEMLKIFYLNGLGDNGKSIREKLRNKKCDAYETTIKARNLYEVPERRGAFATGHHNKKGRKSHFNNKFNNKNKNYQQNNKQKDSAVAENLSNNKKRIVPKMSAAEREKYREYICRRCDKKGHIEKFCYSKKSNVNYHEASGSDDDDHNPATNMIVNHVQDQKSDEWIFDTGSSIHICNNEKWYIGKIKTSDRKFTTSNGSDLISTGKGRVEINLKCGKTISLDDVYLCPDASMNLMTNIGLNDRYTFIVSNKGIKATESSGRSFEFCSIKAGQNRVNINNVTANTRNKDAEQKKQGVVLARSQPKQIEQPTTKRGVGRPRKNPIVVVNESNKNTGVQSEGRASSQNSSIVNENSQNVINIDQAQSDDEVAQRDWVDENNEELLEEFGVKIKSLDDLDNKEDEILSSKIKIDEAWKKVAEFNKIKNVLDVHVKYGHIGEVATAKMCRLLGIKHTNFNCESCRILNLQYEINRNPSLNKTNRPLELVYMDICQPYGNRVEAFDGTKYVLVIMDDFTRYCTIYCIKHKSESFDKFKEWKAQAETRQNVKLVELRSDNALEFVFPFKELGPKVLHTFTVPYVHEQNGSVERLNQILNKRCKKIINCSGVDKKFWPEAMRLACSQHNITINYVNEIPYSKWLNRVDNRLFFEFGQQVAYLRLRAAGELERGVGKFMGYTHNRKAYRILIDESTVRDDIIFIKSLHKYPITDNNTLRIQPGQQFTGFVNHLMCRESSDESEDWSSDEINSFAKNVFSLLESIGSENNPCPVKYSDIKSLSPKWRKIWQDSVKGEIGNMLSHSVFRVVTRKSANYPKTIGSRYVFTYKDGVAKSRLVARGDIQSLESFNETYAPTMQLSILRLLLKIALEKNLKCRVYDVKRAYLNATLKEKVFMEIPDGYELVDLTVNKQHHVILLEKALYGLKQSGYEWNREITKKLVNYGFNSMSRESTIFVHSKIRNFYLALYVDDIIVIAEFDEQINELAKYLKSMYELHESNELVKVLGIRINRTNNYFSMDLKYMIKNLANKFGVEIDQRIRTPLPANEVIDEHTLGKECDYNTYTGLLGSLLYISRMVRPDVLASVVQLCQFQQKPTQYHYRKLKHILCYLINTIDIVYIIRKTGSLKLEVYSDSSLGNTFDKKSMMGNAVLIGSSLISFYSRKGGLIALSTNEAEIEAASESLKELIYFRCILNGLSNFGVELELKDQLMRTPSLYVDNKGVERFNSNGYTRRTKYISIRNAALRDYEAKGVYLLEYVHTDLNLADVFTKNVKYDALNGLERR